MTGAIAGQSAGATQCGPPTESQQSMPVLQSSAPSQRAVTNWPSPHPTPPPHEPHGQITPLQWGHAKSPMAQPQPGPSYLPAKGGCFRHDDAGASRRTAGASPRCASITAYLLEQATTATNTTHDRMHRV